MPAALVPARGPRLAFRLASVIGCIAVSGCGARVVAPGGTLGAVLESAPEGGAPVVSPASAPSAASAPAAGGTTFVPPPITPDPATCVGEDCGRPRRYVGLLYTDRYWAFPGFRLRRDDKRIFVGTFLIGLPEAVRGSPSAERAAWLALGFRVLEIAAAASTIGLLVAGASVYPSEHGGLVDGWPDFIPTEGASNVSTYLTLGAIGTFVMQIVFHRLSSGMAYRSVGLYTLDCLDEKPPVPPDCRRLP